MGIAQHSLDSIATIASTLVSTQQYLSSVPKNRTWVQICIQFWNLRVFVHYTSSLWLEPTLHNVGGTLSIAAVYLTHHSHYSS